MAEEDNVTFVEGEAEIKMEDQSENKQDTDANGGAASTNMEAILARTGYSHEITTGQRKYGGPPPGWEGAPPGSGCEVYCGKVPNTVSEEELILLFEKCGTIWDLRLMLDPLTGQGRGFCFCTFTDKQGAEQAVKQLDGYSIRGPKRLKVNVSIPNCRLFLGNIPKSKTKEDIQEEISKVTEGLVDVIIYTVPDDPRKKNRGFAFLDYDSHKSASNGRKRLGSGRVRVFGCDVIVDWADPLDEPDTETMSKVKVLYVRNLKADVTEEQLRETFGEYGQIEKVKKVKDYGFVHYVERESAIKALEALDGMTINDSVMLVSLAKPPTDAKLKEQRKFQHQQLFNNGRGPMDHFFGGGPPGLGRMMGGGRGRPMRSPMGGRGGGGPVAFRGMNAGYEQDYYGGGGYDAYDGGDYYGNEGYDEDYYGYGGGYDNYGGGGYDEYDYYGGGGMSAGGAAGGYGLAGAPGASRGRARGRGMPSIAAARGGRGGMPIRAMRGLGVGGAGRGAPRGLMSGGLRGAPAARRPFGRGSNGGMSSSRGMVAPRGIKRKAASDFNQSETKKPFTAQDSWTTQPIAQQPLGQQPAYNTSGDTEWYQDSFAAAQWE